MKGPLELRLWDVASQAVQQVIPLDGDATRYHGISYLGDHPMVVFQEKKKLDRSRAKTRGRDTAKSPISSSLHSCVSVFNRKTGQVLYSGTVAGSYTALHAPDSRYIHRQFPISMQTQLLFLSHQEEGVLNLSKVGLSPLKGKFTHRRIKVTSHALSGDCQGIMVGLEDGQVLILRVAQIDNVQFKK